MDISLGTIAYCTREDHAFPLFPKFLAQLCARHPHSQVLALVGNDVAEMRNSAVRQMTGDWLWFIDTDMAFAPETLQRLLDRNVDIVQVLCLRRHPPHAAVMYDNHGPSGYPRLLEVESVGSGGTLYRRKVFTTVPAPWFEGIIGKEDITFAKKALAAGIKLYVDMAVPVGHVTPVIVWPEYIDGKWVTRYDTMNGARGYIPAAPPATRIELTHR